MMPIEREIRQPPTTKMWQTTSQCKVRCVSRIVATDKIEGCFPINKVLTFIGVADVDLTYAHVEIGLFLLSFSAFFCGLGFLLFFDRALLAFGNVSFTSTCEELTHLYVSKLIFFPGLILFVGTNNARSYLIRTDKMHATLCFFGGAVLVLFGWPWLGFIIELFGFVNLFGNFFPAILSVVRSFGSGMWMLLMGTASITSSRSSNK